MTTYEVRTAFLNHFASHGHAIIPSSPIIPQNDPTTLFTGSGMQPMIPYLLGQPHPKGTRICDSQICFRAQDIEEVGDNRHTTFFEMLGNWSLGDFFKEGQIPMMFDFLVNRVGLDPERLYFTAFEGSDAIGIPRDTVSSGLWKEKYTEIGVSCDAYDGDPAQTDVCELIPQGYRVFYYPEKKNWWSRSGVPANMPIGEPGGPDTEMFYDFEPENTGAMHGASQWEGERCHLNCDCGRFVEIGNNVFMEYIKTEKGFEKLAQQNVDFGGGLERIVAASIGTADVFAIDVFGQPRATIEKLSGHTYGTDEKTTFAMRVILDHLRGATFLCADGIVPAAKDQGYFTRRLIRRAVRFARDLGIHTNFASQVADSYISVYGAHYTHLADNRESILKAIESEEEKFRETLEKGLKIMNEIPFGLFDKYVNEICVRKGNPTSEDLFDLYTTYGFPVEIALEELKIRDKNWHDNLAKNDPSYEVNYFFTKENEEKLMNEYSVLIEKHQELSRAGGEAKFKGGLADSSEAVVKLHTAHHLLLAALRAVLGDHVHQKGSNITGERLRIDFSHTEKMTPEQIARVQAQVQTWIDGDLPVHRIEMPRETAVTIGAEMEFGAKYPDMVSVYMIGSDEAVDAISKEFCGGPHQPRTGGLGMFKISKEEASSAGVRRIKATLS